MMSVAKAKDGQNILVNANSMVRDTKEKMIFLKGNVQIIFNGQNLWADQATVNLKTKMIDANQNLILIGPTSRASGESASFNYETNQGVLYNGYIEQNGQVQISGEVIRKIGENEYVVEKGDFTACTSCPPAWNISGSHIEATSGKYAYITNPVIHFGRVPVFWLPYLIVPINSRRQTGLLFPKFGWTSSGTFYTQSFFWAMSDSTDSTWTFHNYQGRGQKGNLNYRYVLSENSWGEFDTAFINDKKLPSDLGLTDTSRIGRHMFKYKNYYDLPEGFVQRSQINYISDTKYQRDFPDDVEGHGDPALLSRMSITKNTDTQHASAEAIHQKNLIAADALSADDNSIHRYPSVLYAMTPQKLVGNLMLEIDGRYNNFARNGPAFDKMSTDASGNPIVVTDSSQPNVFDSSTDLIRTGQRFELEPKLSYPFHIGPNLDLLPSLSYREVNYQFGISDQPSAYRRFIRGSLSVRTKFARVFGDKKDPKATRYKHEIQPEVVYTNAPWVDQADHPFFGEAEPFFKRDQAINNADRPQFDDFDRLYDRHLTTLNIDQVLIRRTANDTDNSYSQLASFKLSQSYDNYEAHRPIYPGEAREPFTQLTSVLDFDFGSLDSNSISRYYHYDKIASVSSRVRFYIPKSKNYLQLLYSQDFQLTKKTTLVSDNHYNTRTNIDNYAQNITTSLGYMGKYIGLVGGTSYAILQKQWTQYNFTITIMPPGDCWGISYTYNQPLIEGGGEASYSINFFLNYGNGIKTVSADAINQFKK